MKLSLQVPSLETCHLLLRRCAIRAFDRLSVCLFVSFTTSHLLLETYRIQLWSISHCQTSTDANAFACCSNNTTMVVASSGPPHHPLHDFLSTLAHQYTSASGSNSTAGARRSATFVDTHPSLRRSTTTPTESSTITLLQPPPSILVLSSQLHILDSSVSAYRHDNGTEHQEQQQQVTIQPPPLLFSIDIVVDNAVSCCRSPSQPSPVRQQPKQPQRFTSTAQHVPQAPAPPKTTTPQTPRQAQQQQKSAAAAAAPPPPPPKQNHHLTTAPISRSVCRWNSSESANLFTLPKAPTRRPFCDINLQLPRMPHRSMDHHTARRQLQQNVIPAAAEDPSESSLVLLGATPEEEEGSLQSSHSSSSCSAGCGRTLATTSTTTSTSTSCCLNASFSSASSSATTTTFGAHGFLATDNSSSYSSNEDPVGVAADHQDRNPTPSSLWRMTGHKHGNGNDCVTAIPLKLKELRSRCYVRTPIPKRSLLMQQECVARAG